MIKKIPVLSLSECHGWRDKVYEQKKLWTPRFGTYGDCPLYFTIGKSVYLDYVANEQEYFSNLQELNESINEVFGHLIQKVIDSLSIELNSPVKLMNGLAVPGFHVFYKDGIDYSSKCEPHYDLQHMRMSWERKREEGKMISFTLPISLPTGGGGLDIWIPKTGLKDEQFEQIIIPYECGTLVLQYGMLLHRISKTPKPTDNDERITLQGHGLCFDGAWEIYW